MLSDLRHLRGRGRADHAAFSGHNGPPEWPGATLMSSAS